MGIPKQHPRTHEVPKEEFPWALFPSRGGPSRRRFKSDSGVVEMLEFVFAI
jgi:hypothetical protein